MERSKSIIKRSNEENYGEIHYKDKYVSLTEYSFGMLSKQDGTFENVKMFVWTNQNKIEAKVITFGARIVSLKVPNRLGIAEDVVLGFDDLNGYRYYEDLYMGATVGRTSNKIRNGTFSVDKKQYWLTKNSGNDHYNGGYVDFSKVNWTPYVFDKKLMLSYNSPDGEEGYEGDLLVKIIFELTAGSEFKINITASGSKVSPVDITNMMYFNLAGHAAGPEELKKHVVLLNANCFTPMPNGLPTGEIVNVVHTRNDFQTPKTLSKVMGLNFDNGYDQNFCVNRGVDQGNAFVARVTHPPSGRILEIYSNQRGVNFYTANRFSTGVVNIPVTPMKERNTSQDGLFYIIKKLEQYMQENFEEYPDSYNFLKTLVDKLNYSGSCIFAEDEKSTGVNSISVNKDFDWNSVLKPLEWQLLAAMKNAIPLVTSDMDFQQIKDVITNLLYFEISPENDGDSQFEGPEFLRKIISKQIQSTNSKDLSELREKEIKTSTLDVGKESSKKSSFSDVPDYMKDGRIHGKHNAIYKKFGAMCLQTQNYPNSFYHNNFPSSILNPNETYSHTITYKFWVQSGNPNRWMKRMAAENSTC